MVLERASTLPGDLLDASSKRRTDIKPRTRINLEACEARLVYQVAAHPGAVPFRWGSLPF
jgi:hypothetical protein